MQQVRYTDGRTRTAARCVLRDSVHTLTRWYFLLSYDLSSRRDFWGMAALCGWRERRSGRREIGHGVKSRASRHCTSARPTDRPSAAALRKSCTSPPRRGMSVSLKPDRPLRAIRPMGLLDPSVFDLTRSQVGKPCLIYLFASSPAGRWGCRSAGRWREWGAQRLSEGAKPAKSV